MKESKIEGKSRLYEEKKRDGKKQLQKTQITN